MKKRVFIPLITIIVLLLAAAFVFILRSRQSLIKECNIDGERVNLVLTSHSGNRDFSSIKEVNLSTISFYSDSMNHSLSDVGELSIKELDGKLYLTGDLGNQEIQFTEGQFCELTIKCDDLFLLAELIYNADGHFTILSEKIKRF